ncbi:alpha-hemolysin translocation ATP-binding HlyB domain protein, partial [Escherichia coli NE037]
NFFTCVDMAG